MSKWPSNKTRFWWEQWSGASVIEGGTQMAERITTPSGSNHLELGSEDRSVQKDLRKRATGSSKANDLKENRLSGGYMGFNLQ